MLTGSLKIVQAAGLLTPSMTVIDINNFAFTITTDDEVKAGRELDEDTQASYPVLAVLQSMTPNELGELRKRVLARESQRVNAFQMV